MTRASSATSWRRAFPPASRSRIASSAGAGKPMRSCTSFRTLQIPLLPRAARSALQYARTALCMRTLRKRFVNRSTSSTRFRLSRWSATASRSDSPFERRLLCWAMSTFRRHGRRAARPISNPRTTAAPGRQAPPCSAYGPQLALERRASKRSPGGVNFVTSLEVTGRATMRLASGTVCVAYSGFFLCSW